MKRAKKVISIVLIIMLAINMTVVSSFGEETLAVEVIPKPTDYSISGSTITGLKADYINSLTLEEKQNIRLVIPEKVGSVTITAIGDSAFKPSDKNAGCSFISIDLSQTTDLKTIGSYAFQDVKSLRGDIILPDTITSLGSQVFYGCTGLDGKLILSDNLTSIPLNAFNGCNFVGTLKLPSKLETIAGSAFSKGVDKQSGFTGKIVFPEGIKSIGSSAFLNQKGIDEIEFTGQELTEIKGSAFKNTGLSGVLKIPRNIKTLGSYFIEGTMIEFVYLPKMETIDFGSNTFDYAKVKATICAREDYQTIYGKLSTAGKGVLTYPLTVNFDDGQGGEYKSRNCLYNFPYNFEQQEDKTWIANTSYEFPEVIGLENMAWAKSKTGMMSVKTTDKAGEEVLYAIKKLEEPVITYSDGIDKVYDGKESILSAIATHPAGVKSTQIKAVGDVIFNYTWAWGTIGSSPSPLSGWDKNQYGVTDVRAPYTIGCSVVVSAYVVTKIENGKATVEKFYTGSHDFDVNLRQAELELSKIPHGDIKVDKEDESLPALPTVPGGQLTWDAGQTLKKGFNNYGWTFTPDPSGVGSTNYKPAKGKTQLCPVKEDPTTESVTNQIDQIPEISKDTEITQDLQDSILDAFLTVEYAESNIKNEIPEEKQDKIFEAIAKLPNVKTEGPETQQIKSRGLEELIHNLTPEEAVLLKDQNTKLDISVKAEEKKPEADALAAIESIAPDSKIGVSFDINIEKTIGTLKGNISELDKPITLTFDLPDEVKGQSDICLIRVHANDDGTQTAEALKDEDSNPNTITVSTDKFSLYAIAYKEKADEPSGGGTVAPIQYIIKASASTGGKISPQGTVNVYGGFS